MSGGGAHGALAFFERGAQLAFTRTFTALGMRSLFSDVTVAMDPWFALLMRH